MSDVSAGRHTPFPHARAFVRTLIIALTAFLGQRCEQSLRTIVFSGDRDHFGLAANFYVFAVLKSFGAILV